MTQVFTPFAGLIDTNRTDPSGLLDSLDEDDAYEALAESCATAEGMPNARE